MNKRSASLLVLVVVASLASFGFQKQLSAQRQLRSSRALAASRSVKGTSSHAAVADWSRRILAANPTPTNIGFLSAIDIPAGGGTFPSFPAVVGDFKGDGTKDVAAIVNTGTTGHPKYNIAAELSNGNGNFTSVLTPTNAAEQDPIFVGDINGDGKDDILLVHPASVITNPTTVQAWLSNGDGTFTAKGSALAITNNTFVWATLFKDKNTQKLDVALADGATPGNIWILPGNGDGTFGTLTSISFTGQLAVGPPGGVPGNPIVFGDFNGDGYLDFAGAAASNNQINVYLSNGGTAFHAPVALTTKDKVYDSCFLAGGDLTGDQKDELVSANCFDNSVTVYVNDGTGFATPVQGTYYSVNSDPVAVSIADVNGDNKADIVATGFQSADVKVLLGNGDGTVNLASVGYVTGGAPLVPALIADFNGDTKADIVLPDNDFSFAYLEGFGDGSFRSGTNYYAQTGNGFHPMGVTIASGDFNGDGIPDYVIGNTNAPSTTGITVFISNADGTLKPGVNYCPGTLGCGAGANFNLHYVAVADFNGDGKLDIVATDSFNGVVQLFTGNGDGTFAVGATSKTDATAGAIPLELAVGDFNGDGKPDLAVVNNHGSPATTANVAILLNNGAGVFTIKSNTALSTVATEVTAADVNGDKKLDLVVPLYGTSTTPGSAVAVLTGNGDGTFNKESDVSLVNGANTYLNPYAVAVGDVNGDGKVDLAVTIEDQKNFVQGIALALGNGNGTFQTPILFPSTLQNPKLDVPLPGYVKIADLNGDGHQDLIYSNSEFSTVGVMYGLGDGTFYDPVEYPADRWAWGLALVDVNGDGALDVVASGNSYDFSGAAVLLNSGGNKTSLSSTANPSNPGASVTLTAQVTATVHGVTVTPTGSVNFIDGTTKLGSGTLNSSGQATYTTTALADGPHAIVAQYGGDTNFLPSNSKVYDQIVGKAAGVVSVTLVSSLNPATPGQSITFTATVKDALGGEPFVPSGKVTFNDGTTALGSGALNASGVATFTTSKLAAGMHSITAQYGGDTNFAAKTSAGLTETIAQPDYSLAVNQASQTVSAGSSAMYTITVTGTNGYDGTVSFPATACSGLPSGTTCTFSKASVAGSGSTVLTIATTGPTAVLMRPSNLDAHHAGSMLWTSLSGLGMMGLVLAGDWKKRNRRCLGIMLGILAIVMILALVGCGGGGNGGGGGGGGGGTPAGNYPIKISVTGTAGSNGGSTSAHTLNVTLVVQ